MMYLIEQLKTYKSGENISPDISETKYIFDQNLGEGLCIFTSFYFPESGLYLIEQFYLFIYLFSVTKKNTKQYK